MSEPVRISLLYPPGQEELRGLSAADPSLVSELAAQPLIQAMRSAIRFKPNQSHPIEYYTDSADVISYRLDVVEDILNNEGLFGMLAKLLPELEDLQELVVADPRYDGDLAASLYSISEIEGLYRSAACLLQTREREAAVGRNEPARRGDSRYL